MFINWKLKASFLSITRIPRYRTRIFALNATESSKPGRYMCHEWFDTASTGSIRQIFQSKANDPNASVVREKGTRYCERRFTGTKIPRW